MRVLILTHHYPPEVGAPQTRLSGTAAFLKQRGHDVRVVAALPSYPTGIVLPSYRGRILHTERIEGIPVVRTWTWARPGSSARLRLANQLSFTISALLAVPRVGRPDVILVESPPLFIGATGAIFGQLLRAPIVVHVSDLWPAVAIELGALRNPLAIRIAELFERTVYRLSRRLIVVTRAWVDQLVARGVPAAKISLVTNGVDTDFLDPERARHERSRLRSELSLDGKVVVACIGTVSSVYDYELILATAQRLRHRDDIHVLIVGDGSQRAAVQDRIRGLGLGNVQLLPSQPHARVRDLLAAADVAVTALLPLPVTRGQLPVRILEAMAMALPVVSAGAGVARELIESTGAGIAVAAGDVGAFAEGLIRLSTDEGLRRGMGVRGRQTIVERFARSTVAERIERTLREATHPHSAANGGRAPSGQVNR